MQNAPWWVAALVATVTLTCGALLGHYLTRSHEREKWLRQEQFKAIVEVLAAASAAFRSFRHHQSVVAVSHEFESELGSDATQEQRMQIRRVVIESMNGDPGAFSRDIGGAEERLKAAVAAVAVIEPKMEPYADELLAGTIALCYFMAVKEGQKRHDNRVPNFGDETALQRYEAAQSEFKRQAVRLLHKVGF